MAVEASSTKLGAWHRFRALRWLSLAALVLLLVPMFFENSLIFIPTRYPEGDWQPSGLEFEDAWFKSNDGVQLHGWYLPVAMPRAYVLFAHGNAGHVAHRAAWLRHLQQELRVAVLAFDYRGFGRSEGRPHEKGVLTDARAARDWLASRAGIEPRQIVLLGESIGGAVVVDLAANDGARGLILENTFTSIPDVAAYHFPWLPHRWLMRTRLDSEAKIGRYTGPLLQCHGDADNVVPFGLGQRLHAAARGPKQFVVIPDGDHNDARSEKWLAALDTFFDQLPAG